MAVIKDVANLTGVSISIASKYFNNPNGLAEPYRSKVTAVVKELNFKPNSMAQGCRRSEPTPSPCWTGPRPRFP